MIRKKIYLVLSLILITTVSFSNTYLKSDRDPNTELLSKILKEIDNGKTYREFEVDYKNFESDLSNLSMEGSTESLMDKAKIFFKKNGLLLNWKQFEKLDSAQKINTLSMIAPVTNEEKQKLLEAITFENKINTA